MSDPSIINLLIVDRSVSDIEHIKKTLSAEGYELDLIQADQMDGARSAIDYHVLDMVLLRPTDDLPSLAEIRLMVAESGQEIPIIMIIDDDYRRDHKPARLLEQGADNYFYLDDADYLVAVVRKELHHLQVRKAGQSYETRFKESETRTQALLENIQEAIAYIHEGVHVYANPAYLKIFGYAQKEDLAKIQLVHMVPPTYRDALKSVLRRSIRSGKAVEPVELIGVRSNGSTFPVLLECAPIRMNDEPCTQVIVHDAGDDKAPHEKRQLEELLKFDELGLYTRRFFFEALEIDRDGSVLYILFTDYAAIRHAMGFEAIEQFVLEASELVKKQLTVDDIATQFASGVFVIYVPTRSLSDPMALAERVRNEIAEHAFQIGGRMFTTTCSIGVCKTTDSSETAIQILSNADRACEKARQQGGNRIEVHVPPPKVRKGTMDPQDEPVIQLIRAALTAGRLSLTYQPIVSFTAAEEARYKAYLQILDEAGNPQAIDKLSTIAARYGVMGALDKWTIIRGLSVLLEIQQVGVKPPILFVRISSNSITDKDFFDWMSKRFKESRLPGQHLVLEIKEDNAEEYFEDAKLLRSRLRELGCGVALSHFGSKAHSDHLLREMAPDYIKLDGGLIERLAKTKDENSRRSMAFMLAEQAQELNTRVVASGVSTAPQMASIWQFGVTLVQGNMVAEAGPRLDFDFKQYAN